MTQADKRGVHTDALETLGNIIGPNEKRDAIHIAVEPVIASAFMYPGTHVRVESGKAIPCFPGAVGAVGIVDPFLTRGVDAGERFWLLVYPRTVTSLRHVWEHPAFVSRDTPIVTIGAPPEGTTNPPEGTPFENCQFRNCDLPGQCQAEGACHHPRVVPPTESTSGAPQASEVPAPVIQEVGLNQVRASQVSASEEWLHAFAGAAGIDFDRMIELASTWEVDAEGRALGSQDFDTRGQEWEGLYATDEFWNHFTIYTGKNVQRGNIFNCNCI